MKCTPEEIEEKKKKVIQFQELNKTLTVQEAAKEIGISVMTIRSWELKYFGKTTVKRKKQKSVHMDAPSPRTQLLTIPLQEIPMNKKLLKNLLQTALELLE